MDYYKVKDHDNLVRDPSTGSILNTNEIDYNKYVAQRHAKSLEYKKTDAVSYTHLPLPTIYSV